MRLPPDHRHQARARRRQQRQRRVRPLGRAVELGNLIELGLLDHAPREIAAAQNLVLRLEIRLRVFVELLALRADAGHFGRALLLDQQAALSAEHLDAGVALNHHRRGCEDEDGNRDPAIAVDHRNAVENVNVGVRGVRRLTWRAVLRA